MLGSFQTRTFAGDLTSAGLHAGCVQVVPGRLRGRENIRSADRLHHRRVVTSAARAGKVWITRPSSRGERITSPGWNTSAARSGGFILFYFGQAVVRQHV